MPPGAGSRTSWECSTGCRYAWAPRPSSTWQQQQHLTQTQSCPLQELLAALNVPSTELQQALKARGAGNASILAWAITKLDAHAARDQAKAVRQELQQLQQQLMAAEAAQWGATSSPLHQLLQGVAAAAQMHSLRALPLSALQQLPLYQAAAAQLQ
jgi:hypothetical protein